MTTPYVDPQTLHNPAAGNKPPATWGDTVRDDLEFLIAPPMCKVHQTTAQTGLTSGAWTAVLFPTATAAEDWDTDAFHSLSTNTSRFTIPTGLGGRYLLIGQIAWDANTTNERSIIFRKGGATFLNGQSTVTANNDGTAMQATTIESLAAGEYVELMAYQDSGGNRDLSLGNCGISVSLLWVSR